MDEIRRNDDGNEQTHPGIETCAHGHGEHDEEQQRNQQDVGDLRVADAREWLRGVHADICAAAEEVAIVDDQDERRKSEALAELLQHQSIFSCGAALDLLRNCCLYLFEEEEDAAVVQCLSVERVKTASACSEEIGLGE